MSQGTAVAPLQLLPCLHHKRTDALKYANTQDRYKFANAQICKCTNTRNTKNVHNSSVVLGGKYQVGGGDLLSIRKPSAVIPVSAGRIYFIICPPHTYLDKYMLQFWQIYFESWTNTFKTLPEAQRIQGIKSITWIMFLTEITLKSFWLKEIIQVTDSIPWVRCASGNVSRFLSTFFNFKKN